MLVIQEIRLRNFDFWSGAKQRAAKLSLEQLDQLEDYLEELYPDGMEETAINDFMWFEEDYIAELLGFDSWEELTCYNETF